MALLHLSSPKLEDLSPLKGIGLKSLALSGEMIKDLSPLKGMALKSLTLSGYQIVDISALQGMPLKTLSMFRTNVHDLTPLEGVPLEFVRLNVDPVPKGMDVLRRMKTITQINHQEPAMFWQHYDEGKVENLRLPRWMYGWD